jgi:hypothetical protein
MAIYDFSKAEKEELNAPASRQHRSFEEEFPDEMGRGETLQNTVRTRDRFFSSFAARLFFLLLLSGNCLWICYAVIRLSLSLIGRLLTAGQANAFNSMGQKAWVSLRRSLVCGVSLFFALFSPSFGIMIACTYFLMYDKSGIEEVVPSSLQSQFKEFFPKS